MTTVKIEKNDSSPEGESVALFEVGQWFIDIDGDLCVVTRKGEWYLCVSDRCDYRMERVVGTRVNNVKIEWSYA